MKFIYTFFLIFYVPVLSFAELGTFKINDQEKPEVILKDGEVGRVVWKDGREAVTNKRLAPNLEVDVPAVIFENSCNGYIASRCAIRPAVHLYQIMLQWSKHPDANKIGKTLIVSEKRNPTEKDPFYVSQAVHFAFNKLLRPLATKNLPDDIIVCEDYKFFPRDPLQNPPLRILRWETEAMYPNPETGGMENRSVAGAFDIDLIQQPNSTNLRLQVKGGYTSASGSPFLVSGDVISWTLRNTNQEICQIGLKPNIGIFQPKFLEYLSTVPDKYGPYIYGSDEMSKDIFEGLPPLMNSPDTIVE